MLTWRSPENLPQSLLPACLSPAPIEAPADDDSFGGPTAPPPSLGDAGGQPSKGRRHTWAAGLIGSAASGILSWPGTPRGPPPAPSAAAVGGASFHSQPDASLSRSGSSGSGGGASAASFVGASGGSNGGGGGRTGAWQVLWRSEQQQHSLCFEATQEA
jgi:hypothetical protein